MPYTAALRADKFKTAHYPIALHFPLAHNSRYNIGFRAILSVLMEFE